MKPRRTLVFALALILASICGPRLFADHHQSTVTVRFSPNGGIRQEVIRAIRSARTQITIAMYVFTDIDIADELVSALRRGVKVFVVIDRSSLPEMKSSVHDYLSESGVAVKLVGIPRSAAGAGAKMHNKFMIVDRETVLTGSYNFTNSAEGLNDENIVIFRHAPKLAVQFYSEFLRIWGVKK